MEISSKVKNNIIKDCNSFFEKYHTLNEYAVKRYHPSLFDRVKKYYSNLRTLRKEIPDLPLDNGSRIWNYNNCCLFLGRTPPEVPHPEGIHLFRGLIKKDCKSIENVISNLFSCLGLPENKKDEMVHQSKEGIYYINNNPFDFTFIILEDRFRGSHFNSSEYAFTKYKKDVSEIVKKNKNPLFLEFYDNFLSTENFEKQLSFGGINLHQTFNIISIDPPTKKNLGYCIMHYNCGEITILESNTHYIDNSKSRGFQLKSMSDFVGELWKVYGFRYFVSESAFGFGQENVRTLLSENVGLFQYLAELYSIPFLAISPKSFKSYVLGDSEADKEATIKWAKEKFKVGKEIQEHEADAIAIAIAFLTNRELINCEELR